ncbi:lactosylceramide 1,3-N-acetyl-beta-D-glucosaminyltransferase A-like [Mercenaria mercenaria]|uniref:lactosylceramide 1,3-N-acetyl-beta-D-glucosaminyltransferase A-like n=1 Tax=Mercenaria mercenaria TaxID=6596 RepID=UPI00234FB00E|nr:lactosylceramide 1,3-N-acetyl-beta-D-glucosaminyltransferase A-like [Mercenaria mercenaria]
MENADTNAISRKMLLLFGRKARRKIAVILGGCFIYLFILLNWQLINQHVCLDRGNKMFVSKYFLSTPLRTSFVNDSRKYEYKKGVDLNNGTEIISKSHLTSIASRNITLKQSLGKADTFSPTTFHVKSHFHNIAPNHTYTENDLTKITLKPNFSKMINASQIVSTIYTPYLLENRNLCSSVENLSVLIIVHTATDHIERRKLIRATWANNTFYLTLGIIRILFLLGKPGNETIQKQIEGESMQYEDILQGDFIDSYHNLTLKGVMTYKWLAERCKNAKFILKVDDDILVNVYKLFTDILPVYTSKHRQIICNHIITNTMPIIRKNNSKWFVHQNHFRGHGRYPTDYCSGFLVIFTNDLMPAFYSSAQVTPFFWVDDVYLYGLVPGNVPGVKYNGLKGNWHQLSGQEALKCFRNVTRTCDYLAIGAGGHGEIDDIWPHVVKRYHLPMSDGKINASKLTTEGTK